MLGALTHLCPGREQGSCAQLPVDNFPPVHRSMYRESVVYCLVKAEYTSSRLGLHTLKCQIAIGFLALSIALDILTC